MIVRFALLLACATLPAVAPAQSPVTPPSAAPALAAGIDDATVAARLRTRLLAGDTDHDGRLSRAEWLAMRAAMPARGGSGGGGGAGGGGGGAGGGGAGRAYDPGRMFDRLDTNGDGFLDSAEIDSLIRRRMARMDADGDGRVTRGERRGGMSGGAAPGGAGGAAQDGKQPD